jgi:hypothetical protein
MRGHRNDLAWMTGQHRSQRAQAAPLKIEQRLTAAWVCFWVPFASLSRSIRELGFYLRKTQAFQLAEAAFAQTRLQADGQTQALRQRGQGGLRTLAVAAVQVLDAFISQGQGQLPSLPMACGVKFDVPMALQALLRIPCGLPMAHQYQTHGLSQRLSQHVHA